jgi:hypothetical protein
MTEHGASHDEPADPMGTSATEAIDQAQTGQPPAAAIPPPSEGDAARLQAEVVYSVTAGPESTADLDEVARAKARRDQAAASTPPDENWLHSAE